MAGRCWTTTTSVGTNTGNAPTPPYRTFLAPANAMNSSPSSKTTPFTDSVGGSSYGSGRFHTLNLQSLVAHCRLHSRVSSLGVLSGTRRRIRPK